MKVLLIEDNPDSQSLYNIVLGGSGNEIFTAATVNEAQQLIEEEKTFDVVLSDVRVPGSTFDGHIVEVLKDRLGENLNIVLLSGLANIAEIAETYGARWLQKPFSNKDLSSIVLQ